MINTKYIQALLALALILLYLQPAFSQATHKKPDIVIRDSSKPSVTDTMMPGLVIKVASYTATIDHTDFLIRRKFDITPIALNMPDIERKVKGFKSRLEKRGNQMNLRSLNSGVIMLEEISGKLTSYQKILTNFSTDLTQSNAEVKKILHDPILNLRLTDSVLLEQLHDIRTEGQELDSIQQHTTARVNLLRNKVSVNLLQATDIISDMRYLTISYKIGMWDKEAAPLFVTKPSEYNNRFADIAITALERSWLIIAIYLNGKWNVITIGLMFFIFIFSWTLINVRRVKKQQNAAEVLLPVHFLNRNVLIASLMAFFTYLPFFFANPPMSFLHTCELLRLAALTFLIYPYLTKDSKLLWAVLCALWVYYALDDILLEFTFGERWALFVAAVVLSVVTVKIIISKKPNFKNIPESTATKALAIFTLTQAILSIIFNITGRASLAKIFGVSAIQVLVLGVSLKVFCAMVLEAIYLQSEAFHESRFAEFINFKTLQYHFLRVLWILSVAVWTVSLVRNLTLYDVMLDFFNSFFNETRTIGSMVFTFKSIAVFICIIWLSSVISGMINFFFGNEKVKTSNNRTRIGSMMLLIRLTIWTLGFCVAVAAAGIPLDKLSLMLGALGVGIGFGLQNIVNNLVSGVIIAFERPIQVGDLIEVGGKMGVVKEIGVRSSKINNNEGADIIVPNGDLLSQHLINWTMQDRSKQVSFSLCIPYLDNIKQITASIQERLADNKKLMQSHTPAVIVQQFGESTIELKVVFWVADLADAGTVRTEVMIDTYELLASAGVSLSIPKGVIIEQPSLKNILPKSEK